MMYTFQEVPEFKLRDYTAHIGWITEGYNPYKIYSREGSENYFLHDEQTDRLFEFSTGGEKLKSKDDADLVIAEYLKFY